MSQISLDTIDIKLVECLYCAIVSKGVKIMVIVGKSSQVPTTALIPLQIAGRLSMINCENIMQK